MGKTSGNSTSLAGVSITSSGLCLALADNEGIVISSKTVNLQLDRSIADQIHELTIEHNSGFEALGIALPGMIETSKHIVVESRIAELTGLDLRSDLGELVDGHIAVENDANATAFAEFKIGAAKESRNVFYVSIGEGIGGGLVLDGRLWRGVSGFAGEIASIVVEDEGTRLDEVASVPSIVRRTQHRFHQDSTSILNKLEEQEIGLSDILAAAALEDDLALLMLERTGTYLGTAVAAVLNVLNIETVVIGGEITRSNGIFLNAINTRVRECTPSRIFENTRIVVSTLDEKAPAIGAALLAANLE